MTARKNWDTETENKIKTQLEKNHPNLFNKNFWSWWLRWEWRWRWLHNWSWSTDRPDFWSWEIDPNWNPPPEIPQDSNNN